MSDLADDLGRVFEAKLSAALVDAQKAMARDVLARIVAHSPVRSGRYRDSHRIAIGDASGGVAVSAGPAAIDAVLADLKPFDRVVIWNPLPYARRIEFGRLSLQAPDGVYRRAAAEAVARLRTGG